MPGLHTSLEIAVRPSSSRQALFLLLPVNGWQMFYTFLNCRSDSGGCPLSPHFAPPLEKELGWFRLPWLLSGGDSVSTVLEAEGWVRAWHGTQLEALYSQIYLEDCSPVVAQNRVSVFV